MAARVYNVLFLCTSNSARLNWDSFGAKLVQTLYETR